MEMVITILKLEMIPQEGFYNIAFKTHTFGFLFKISLIMGIHPPLPFIKHECLEIFEALTYCPGNKAKLSVAFSVDTPLMTIACQSMIFLIFFSHSILLLFMYLTATYYNVFRHHNTEQSS